MPRVYHHLLRKLKWVYQPHLTRRSLGQKDHRREKQKLETSEGRGGGTVPSSSKTANKKDSSTLPSSNIYQEEESPLGPENQKSVTLWILWLGKGRTVYSGEGTWRNYTISSLRGEGLFPLPSSVFFPTTTTSRPPTTTPSLFGTGRCAFYHYY